MHQNILLREHLTGPRALAMRPNHLLIFCKNPIRDILVLAVDKLANESILSLFDGGRLCKVL